MTSTPSDAQGLEPDHHDPEPLTTDWLASVPGVLGEIGRERAADYEGAAAPAGAVPAPEAAAGRLLAALAGPGIALIAEIKRASPARGPIAALEPAAAARAYEAGGAAALSVLTEPRHFDGAREHLRAAVRATALPLVRKDFVVHPAQLHEARADGAAGVLLIAALLGPSLGAYLARARSLALDALVEVHDEAELDAAMALGADLIGVNNRDLRTLAIDPATAPRLIEHGRNRGHAALWVAESGYSDARSLEPLHALADAVLIGTSLARSGDLTAATRQLVAAARRPSGEPPADAGPADAGPSGAGP